MVMNYFCVSGEMVSVVASSVVDCKFDPGIYCLSTINE